MILLAESGSSKTEWIFADKASIVYRCLTRGLNPYFVSSDEISNIIEKEIIPNINFQKTKQIFFYGAGCSSEINKKVVLNGFSKLFVQTKVEVDHDLMAATRALFNDSEGIACILGTGANACIFDGKKIIHKINSLGYILGDEGSGAYLGKMLLSKYFNNELPSELAEKFKIEFKVSLENVLDSVYKKPFPNKYLASFSPFIKQNLDNETIYISVKNSFIDFFKKMILVLPNFEKYQIGLVGSIAYEYQNIIREVFHEFGISNIKIIKNPAEALIKYHQQKCW